MQCCVPNCTSNEIISENSGITYHEFPKDPQTRLQWMEHLKLVDYTPDSKSVVCSLHFNDEGFLQPELCAVKTDVDVPDMSTVCCRICLCSDRKLYNIGENDILQQYELLTANKDISVVIVPQYICWECKARLASFSRLRCVALRSLRILHDYHKTVMSKEPIEDIQSIIDRDTNNLSSTLATSHIEIVDYPPNSELLVEFDVKPDNIVNDELENRNDNNKNTSVHNNLSKRRKNTALKNDIDNSVLNTVNKHLKRKNISKVLIKRKKRKKVLNVNDNSDFNDIIDNFESQSVLNKEANTTEVENKNDNFDFNHVNDNISELYDKTIKKSDDINSELDDIIYDSDSTKSENEDVHKIDSHLAKINTIFDRKKLSLIKKGINFDSTRIKQGKYAIDDKSMNDKDLENMFEIKHFTKEEQLEEFLLRKESDNYKNSGFKCEICFKGFLTERTFKQHKIKHTDVDGPIKCPLCGINFKSPLKMRMHSQECHESRYNCNKCNFVTVRFETAKSHLKFHKGTIYKCTHCEKTFQKQSTMLTHVRTVHPSNFVCHLCGNSFVNAKGLHNHKLFKHKLDNLEVPADGPRCIECNLQFSNETALQTHYQKSNKHKHLLPEQPRKRRAVEGAELRVYTNPPNYNKRGPVTCEICSLELPNYMNYQRHFKKCHPDKARTQFSGNFMCEICGLVCASSFLLQSHRDIHSDTLKYPCEECDKRFKTRNALYVHKYGHHKKSDKIFACDTCGNTFSSWSNLQKHKIIHENLKFDCDICGQSFNTPYNRKNHVDFVHLKKPWPVRKNRGRTVRQRKNSAESSATTNYD